MWNIKAEWPGGLVYLVYKCDGVPEETVKTFFKVLTEENQAIFSKIKIKYTLVCKDGEEYVEVETPSTQSKPD